MQDHVIEVRRIIRRDEVFYSATCAQGGFWAQGNSRSEAVGAVILQMNEVFQGKRFTIMLEVKDAGS